MSIFEIVLIAIGVVGGFALLFYLSKDKPDRRLDMNDLPDGNHQVLTEEEIKVKNDFVEFLKENKAFDSKSYFDLGNYNVNPGSKGVFKLKDNVWILYEMAGWKELKLERRFDNQVKAYKYYADLRNLNWEVEETS